MSIKRPLGNLSTAAGLLLGTFCGGVQAGGVASAAALPASAALREVPAVGGILNGIAATSAHSAWAVGSSTTFRPMILRWNGSAWTEAASPNLKDGQLLGVTALSARNAWAVGSYVRGTLIMSWDGTAWQRVPSPNPPGGTIVLQGVAAPSARDAWAVGTGTTRSGGERSLILHWNGVRWKQVPGLGLGSSELTAVAATSARNAWAVGAAHGHTLILRWNGTVWKRVRSPVLPAGTLNGITATSAGNAWAAGLTFAGIGTRPLILRWNGSAWKRVRSPNPPSEPRGNQLFAISAVSAQNAWAVGGTSITSSAGQTLVLHWNGSAWKRVRSPSPPGGPALLGVAATSARSAWAVGYTTGGPFSVVILHWDGTNWRRQV